MATYNREAFIGESLKYIQDQTFKEWQCLVIDDGSTDNTEELLKEIIKSDPRIEFHRRPTYHKKGLPGARNFGLELADGEYIIFIDDDDIVHPLNFELCLEVLQKSKNDFCRFLRETFVGEFNKRFDLSINYEYWAVDQSDIGEIVEGKIPFNSCQVMWKKECFSGNKFNESLMYAEEWECYTRILLSGFKGLSIDKVLFFGRKHQSSNTGEFWNKNSMRRASKVEATKLIVEHLAKHKSLTNSLIRFFIQEAVFLKEKILIRYVLNASNSGNLKRIKYNLFYDFYPFIVLGYRWKKKIKNFQY